MTASVGSEVAVGGGGTPFQDVGIKKPTGYVLCPTTSKIASGWPVALSQVIQWASSPGRGCTEPWAGVQELVSAPFRRNANVARVSESLTPTGGGRTWIPKEKLLDFIEPKGLPAFGDAVVGQKSRQGSSSH